MVKQRKNPKIYIILAGIIILFGILFDEEFMTKTSLVALTIIYFINNWTGRPNKRNSFAFLYVRVRNDRR
jgi:hypothetical protein